MDKYQTLNLPELCHRNLYTFRNQLRDQLIQYGLKIQTQRNTQEKSSSKNKKSARNSKELPQIQQNNKKKIRKHLKQTIIQSCREVIHENNKEKILAKQFIRGYRYENREPKEESKIDLKEIIHKKVEYGLKNSRYPQAKTQQNSINKQATQKKIWSETIRIIRLDRSSQGRNPKQKRSKTEGQVKEYLRFSTKRKTEKGQLAPWQVDKARDTKLIFN